MPNLKTIGLIGGVSWESTVAYYKIINNAVKEALGGKNSGKIIINSVNFNDIYPLLQAEKWDEVTGVLTDAALKLQAAGADMILICSNTCNKPVDEINESLNIPVIHIADVTGEAIVKANIKSVSLIGSNLTMTGDFIAGRLEKNYNLNVLIPDEKDREFIDYSIFNEMCVGIFSEESRKNYISIINSQIESGAEGVILGCTEIPLLVSQKDFTVPVFDTTRLHAMAAVKNALQRN